VTGEDIAEQIVWVASRPDHVQVAELRKPSSQLRPALLMNQSFSQPLKLLLLSITRGLEYLDSVDSSE
jgi:hypothetical protein